MDFPTPPEFYGFMYQTHVDAIAKKITHRRAAEMRDLMLAAWLEHLVK